MGCYDSSYTRDEDNNLEFKPLYILNLLLKLIIITFRIVNSFFVTAFSFLSKIYSY